MSAPLHFASALSCFGGPGESQGFELSVELSETSHGGIRLLYKVKGPLEHLHWPEFKKPEFVEGLWEDTVFEFFWGEMGSTVYEEWNFSPSGDWACFQFSDYRERVIHASQASVTKVPEIRSRTLGPTEVSLEVTLTGVKLPRTAQVGLTAILNFPELGPAGVKTYWALKHPGTKPDFHDRRGFLSFT